MIIQHNMTAMNANRQLGITNSAQAKSTEKLSSGYRINRAADDAAGLSISEKMRGQIRGLDQASTNAQDGISLIQTAEGALNESHSILQRMRQLSVQAANGTETDDDRAAVQDEISQLQEELTRISETTEFNTMKLLDGTWSATDKGVTSGSTITGAADVFTAKAASITGATALSANPIYAAADAAGLSEKDTVTIDGTSFTIDWSNELSDTTKVALVGGVNGEDFGTELAAEMESIINAKINEWNETTGSSVANIKLSYDTTSKLMTLTSGTTGAASKLTVESSGAATNTASLMGKLGLDSDGKIGTVTVGQATGNATGTYTLNAALTANAGENITLDVNGQKIQVDALTAAAKGDDVNAARVGAGTGLTATDIDTDNDGVDDITIAAAPANASIVEELEYQLRMSVAEAMKAQGLSKGDENYVDANSINVTFKQGSIVIEAPENAKLSLSGKQAEILGIATDSETALTGKSMTLQIGANEGQTMSFNIEDMSAEALGVDGNKVDLSTQEGAQKATTIIDAAINKVSQARGRMGAIQNRLEHTISNLDTASENTQSAESRIRDVDMAAEMVTYSKNNILAQAGQSMLAQANQSTQGVLSLLQ